MARKTVAFDHLALGVESLSDGFPCLAGQLGGRWALGGDSGDFMTGQLAYREDMRVELIAPSGAGGFMRRFLDKGGPRPHHLTFKVPSLEEALEAVGELGVQSSNGRVDMPFWREAFLHPKVGGLGTLVQLVESDDEFIKEMSKNNVAPPDFPESAADQQGIAWVGVTAESLDRAERLLCDVLSGAITGHGAGWFRASWGTGHSIVVRSAGAQFGEPRLWQDAAPFGVDHVMFGPDELPVAGADWIDLIALEPSPAVNLRMWLASTTKSAGATEPG